MDVGRPGGRRGDWVAGAAIPHGPHGPRLARRWVEAVVGTALPARVLADLLLLTSELVGNCVAHGAARPDGTVGLRLRVADGVVRLSAEDAGGGRPRRRRFPRRGATGGRGLRLVGALADRWGVVPGAATVVWVELEYARAQGRGGRSLSERFASSLKRTAARAKAAHSTKTVTTAPIPNRTPELSAR
ncbi:MAG: ATP-binding protein [Actinomycetota bacterium]